MAFSTLALAALVAACGGERSAPAPAADAPLRPRGVVLISIDALRADSLGPYGSVRETTPFLDRLAGRATVFENAFAQVPSTLPSHMSMFTGLYPSEHQVDPPSSVLSDQIRTLPEVLRKAGFRTFGHTEGGYVQGGYGFARGFEEWSDTPYARDTDVERTLRAGLDSLAGVRAGERFFLFLHTYSVHDPYDPPPGYRTLPWMGPRPAGAFDPTGPNLAAHNEHRVAATPEAIEWFRGLYDAGVRYLDDQLAVFFAELERTGLADETVVILTSDHGEEFGEHGHLAHTQAYPECLRIPLLVVAPGRGAARVARLVETVDFAPTIYELTGVAAPPDLPGRSRAADLGHGDATLEGFAYAQNDLLGFDERTIVQAVGGSLYQLYRAEALVEPDGFWVSRRIEFDARPPRLDLRAVALGAPRRVEVFADGRKLEELVFGTDWASRGPSPAAHRACDARLRHPALPRPGHRRALPLLQDPGPAAPTPRALRPRHRSPGAARPRPRAPRSGAHARRRAQALPRDRARRGGPGRALGRADPAPQGARVPLAPRCRAQGGTSSRSAAFPAAERREEVRPVAGACSCDLRDLRSGSALFSALRPLSPQAGPLRACGNTDQ